MQQCTGVTFQSSSVLVFAAPINTLLKMYAIYLKMYTTKCKFYVIQTIFPLPLHQKAMGETVRAWYNRSVQMLNK